VIVNHTHKFIFVHVPKSAGTSVTQMFSEYSSYRDLEVGGTPLGEALQNEFKKRFGLTKHATASEIRAIVGDELWKAYFSFGIVRNPYARAQSTFHFMKRWRGNKEMDRLKFIENMPDFRSFALSPKLKRKQYHRLLWSQTQWLCDDAGKLLVSQVGRLESLDADLARIQTQIPGLPERPAQAVLEAPKRNKSDADDEALTQLLRDEPEVEQALYEAYKDDFANFGYPRFTR
jgi:hypothetical protein